MKYLLSICSLLMQGVVFSSNYVEYSSDADIYSCLCIISQDQALVLLPGEGSLVKSQTIGVKVLKGTDAKICKRFLLSSGNWSNQFGVFDGGSIYSDLTTVVFLKNDDTSKPNLDSYCYVNGDGHVNVKISPPTTREIIYHQKKEGFSSTFSVADSDIRKGFAPIEPKAARGFSISPNSAFELVNIQEGTQG